jgi:hypothetical protein
MSRQWGLVVCILAVACGGKSVQPESDGGADRGGSGRSSGGADGTGGFSDGTGGSSGRSSGGTSGRSSGGAGGQAPPPAQAAVTLKVGVAPGKICSHTSPQIAAPAVSVAGVIEELSCDLSQGCKPDEYVVVDRDRGVTVSCTVAPSGDTFNVSLRLSVDGTSTGSESIAFGLNGVISQFGGTASVNEQNSAAGGGGTDNACKVVITPPRGLVKQGGIWGTVECDNFRDLADISETGCVLSGTFLFENCAS